MILGITEKEQSIVINILEEYKRQYNFYYYGSRVKGNYNKTSDLDILIRGSKEMPVSELAKLKEKMDESKLPYIVNFSDYHSIDDKFFSLIKNDLVLITKDKRTENDL